MEKVGKKKK